MKRLIPFFALICLITTSFAQESAASKTDGPAISWEMSTHDFGDIYQGDRVEQVFKFTNSGSAPLIITNVEVTCGCTTPKGWPRDPIAAGASGEITVAFNSTGKYGKQNKVVTIVSNAVNGNNQITFTANVLEKKSPN